MIQSFRRISAALAVAALTATSAAALTPIPPCDGAEGGMAVASAAYFGHPRSGLVMEDYSNLNEGNVIGGAPGPIPQLDGFLGVRITDCRTGRMLAIDGVQFDAHNILAATEFLRADVQAERPLKLADVQRAAKAVWGQDDYVRLIDLRETEETCACREFYHGRWR